MGDHFFPDEPVAVALRLTRSPGLDSMLCNRFKNNLSLMMVNRKTDEVMGVRINHVIRRSDVINVDGLPKESLDLATFFYTHSKRYFNF